MRSRIRCKNKGDMVLKEFFKAEKEKSLALAITCLRDATGQEV